METLSYKIESFEGPMDLLLHLISKHKVRIEDVPIMDLINQYLDYMKKLKEENLEVASEFLEMAARLVYIKTVSLLPVHEEADRLAEELSLWRASLRSRRTASTSFRANRRKSMSI